MVVEEMTRYEELAATFSFTALDASMKPRERGIDHGRDVTKFWASYMNELSRWYDVVE